MASAAANSHPHGTRLNRKQNIQSSTTAAARPARPQPHQLTPSQLSQILLQRKLQSQQNKVQNIKPSTKKPNLNHADRTLLYQLMEIHKPIGTEMWKQL